MKRGDLVVAVFPGEYGNPRPAIIVQTSATSESHPSLTLCPLTSDLDEFPEVRVRIAPSSDTNLRAASDAMVDKLHTLPRAKVRARIGSIDSEAQRSLDTALRVWLGLA
jgi:mRNA interferase MazF